MSVTASPRLDAARRTLARGGQHLRGLQHPDGWWKGELETNVTIDAEDLFVRHYLGILTPEQAEATARWIRSKQREDGSWATFYAGPPDLSTTTEAYVALRLAGDAADAANLRKAAELIRDTGGVERTRVFTRMWLSLLGLWSWEHVPVLPPEQILLPARAPLSIYSFGCWARQTLVALSIASALRPAAAVLFGIDELRTKAEEPMPSDPWARAFTLLDRGLHRYERRPVAALRRRALGAAERWVVDRQEADGSWGGIQPPWVWSIVALHALGYPLDHPVIVAGLRGLEGFTHVDGDMRWIEACQSPVWDTCLAITALLDAGAKPADPAVKRASEWLLAEEVTVKGDWAVRRPHLAPGGWAFEFANDNYPDIDDTAEVVLALNRVGDATVPGIDTAIERGLAWMVGMQSRDGGWGAFDADNVSGLIDKLPFCDFGAVTDPPTADVTAHVVEALAHLGGIDTEAGRRGVQWLLDHQEVDGSWFGRWGANYIYGTGAVVPALVVAGIGPDAPAIRRAVRWLERHQNDDGGWGEDLRSYVDASWRGRGESTASQTAWALLALLAAAEEGDAVDRGIDYLVRTQREDGCWDEELYTGTGFPGDFYINYEMYRLLFPLSALGRYLARKTR
jgi:squalene-hopene/tetraprenyl-beta-curcumene cyclase